jgi:hypothetical protein
MSMLVAEKPLHDKIGPSACLSFCNLALSGWTGGRRWQGDPKAWRGSHIHGDRAGPDMLPLSVTDAVTMCVPTDSACEMLPPVPSSPSADDVQRRLDVRLPILRVVRRT